MQRAAPPAAADLGLGLARCRKGGIAHDGDVGANQLVVATDPIETGLGQFDGRHIPAPDEISGLRERQRRESRGRLGVSGP